MGHVRRFSLKAGPVSCSPTGRPSERPQGIDSEGRPARLEGIVQTSDRYIARGSWTRSPSRKATVGEVGETITSTRSKAASKSWRMSVRTFCARR